MVLISPRARLLTTLVALLLLLPVLCTRLQNPATLESFHNRTLRPWPVAASFPADPVRYFQNAKAWLADRAFPIIEATKLQRKVLYYVFDTAPQRRISLGSNGFVFLNGSSDAQANEVFETNCIVSHGKDSRDKLAQALPQIAQYAQRRGVAVDVIVVPTLATLYAQHLPPSVPEKYRKACREVGAGVSALLDIAPTPGVNFVFPLNAMRAASADEAFFPKGNWHAIGKSVAVARDAYLHVLGAAPPAQERLEPGVAPAELLEPYGIVVWNPIYFVRNAHVRSDPARSGAFAAAIASLFPNPHVSTAYYANDAPVLDQSVLMVSDSYGHSASEVFAGAFRDLSMVVTNGMATGDVGELVDRASRLQRIDRVILLVQEGSVDRIVGLAQGLAAWRPQPGADVSPAP
jgi:hypothetical protein